jgi:hypothetical protein
MPRLIAFLIAALLPTSALPQHICESTGKVVCGEGQEWNPEQAKCLPIVSS